MRSIVSAAAMFLLTAPAAFPQQDIKTNCNQQACTVTVDFGVAEPQRVVTGAPYSGRQDVEPIVRTLPDGSHTTVVQPPGLVEYRDSKGRVRTDRPVLRRPPGGRGGQSPDTSVIADIQDPVAGYRYILDPVNHVAHRLVLQSRPPVVWKATETTEATAPSEPVTTTMPGGSTSTYQSLGTKDISGVTAVGRRTTSVGPASRPATTVSEYWFDPRTGVNLVSKSTLSIGASTTLTMDDYRAAEPDPALFRIPNDYRVVDETGVFNIVHPTMNANAGVHSQQAGLTISRTSCTAQSCTLAVSTGGGLAPMITGAPYFGALTSQRALTSNPPSAETVTYRDSQGRIRVERPAAPSLKALAGFNVVTIQDPVAGYYYLLDSVNRVAHRMPLQAGTRSLPVKTGATVLQAGFVGVGANQVVEDLGTRSISGVSAVGQRTTRTMRPNTINENDRPVAQINERWTDPSTGVDLILRIKGPNGDETLTVQNYSTAEPDAALFRVPDGYKVVDELGSFNMIVPVAN